MESTSITSQSQRFCRGRSCEFLLLGIILMVAVLGVYHPVKTYPFTNWDDIQFIVDNPCLNSSDPMAIGRMFVIGGVPGEKLYIPLTYVSYFLEKAVFGLTPDIVHRNNLWLHVVNALLVMMLYVSFRLPVIAAFIGAGLWALHPVTVEPVAWAMGRKELLAGFFGLMTLLGFKMYLTTSQRRWWWGSILFFSLGSLCKPSLLVLPGVIFLIEYYEARNLSYQRVVKWLTYAPIAALIYWLNLLMPDDAVDGILPWQTRLQGMSYVLLTWSKRLLLIDQPNPFYCWPEPEVLAVNAKIGVFILVVIGIIVTHIIRKRWALPLVGVLFVGVLIIPALMIVWEGRDFITADRYGYFPMIGLWLVVVSGFREIKDSYRPLYLGLCISILVIFGYRSQQQIRIWGCSVDLWNSVLSNSPELVMARNNLGMAYLDQGVNESAIAEFKKGLKVEPYNVPILKNLCRIYLDRNRIIEAEDLIKPVLSTSLNDSQIIKLWADIQARKNLYDEAIGGYNRAIQLNPDYVSAYFGLGDTQEKIGNHREALSVYQRALLIAPLNPYLLNNTGVVYEHLGMINLAIKMYSDALRIKPDYVDANFNLANVYLKQENYSAAMQNYQKVLKLDSTQTDAMINIGNTYFQLQEWDNAIRIYRMALEVNGNVNPRLHFNLGLAYARLQDKDRALEQFRQAIVINHNFGEAYYESAKIEYQLNRIDAAKVDLKQAKSLGINIPPFWEKLLHNPGQMNDSEN